ncbi:PREDICTED: centromere protein J isoform X1 [Calidris pugnax]|uniref:centromere protein J isoform X1 n=1 Tax=Calidris pugnax TaxID=198806 RepID=UPI00071E4342|nr:PREDICTED: centromere protein J isoform X1 [Calidris pugnax]XP_014821289.1 PREDICTED: centromere protein J isoform X1 [Calidris pugnax]
MLMLYQQINWNTVYKMPTVEDLSSEQNFIAHWMSDCSRAGVLLDPNFTGLKINKGNVLSGPENVTAFPAEVSHLSEICSLSEDSLCEEESGSACTLRQYTTETSFPAAACNTEASKTDFVRGEEDGRSKSGHSDRLLQKLEKLKELQQQKQEQLKKQQMEQLQRLMEEQQKLLSMVAGQTAVLGHTVMAESPKLRPGHSVGLTTLHQLPSSGYQNHFEDRAYAPVVSPHTQDSDLLQKLNNKECTSTLKSSPSEVSACGKQGKNMGCLEQKMEILMESEDHHIDPLCAESADLSESSSRGKDLWTNTEERPIKATIQEKKQTFEEFLEEQIQLEEQRLEQNQKLQETNGSAIQKPVIKRPFLKKGEGLTRFINAKSKITKLGENTPKLQQRASDDRNVIKVDRSQMQKKTIAPGKDLVSEKPFALCKKYNNPHKAKHRPIQKTLVLGSHNGKNISSLETRMQLGKNHDGQTRDSFPSEINNKIENKENVEEFAMSNTGKIGNKLLGTEKPQLSHEPGSAFSNSKCPVGHSVKDPELSFEVSFQHKLENWEKEKEKENLELDEFLFLEQAADEISFSSNSSFVQRILDQDQQTLKGRRMSSTPIKAKEQQVKALAVELLNRKNQKADCMTQGNTNDRAVLHTVSNSGTAFSMKDSLNKMDSVMFSASSMTAAPALKSNQWTVNEDEGEGDDDTTTDSESESETTLKHENDDVKTSFMSHRESDPEFFDDGGSVTDISKGNKNGDAALGLSDKGCSELSKQKIRKASDHQRSMSCMSRSKFEFDDERTWSDLDENYVNGDLPEKYTKIPLQMDFSSKNDTPVPDKAIKRKVASKRGDGTSKESAVDSDSNRPPVSNLMMKLFPSLKPKHKAGGHSERDIKSNMEQEPAAERTATGNTVPSQVLRDTLAELETEIARFRAENSTLTKLREEREHALANIRKEIADFQQQKAQELAEIEEYKKKEIKKLQKERKVFEKYTTEARAIPDKKERDEIQALKQQVAELQEDLKRKEAKWSTTHRRLKDQIEALVNENMELKEEVKIMERFRLEAWKKVEAAENKKKIENPGMTLKKAESFLPNRGPKSQTASLLPPVQKGSKINGKSYSQAKGKLSRTPPSAPASDGTNSETMMALEDSSKTFMVDSSPQEAHGSLQSGPASTDSEEIERETAYPDGKVEKVLKNGCHLIFFPNGTWKKVGSDGKTVTVTFFNGDVKQVMPDQTVIYYYADAKTTHTTYSDGLEVLQFSNGQIEKHYPDGKKEITFPDQTIKNLFTDGQEESIFPDGTIVRIQRDGSKTIEFNNGQRELHTSEFKRREYPDGTVKTVYVNGQQETKYVSGRVRVKDKDGNVIMDTKL